MTLFFNIQELEKAAGSDSFRFLELLKRFYLKKLPKRIEKPINLVGSSFILNPEPLFYETVDIGYVIQYIRLAARRDYLLYKQFGTVSLPRSFFPDIDYNSIKHNPLIKITEDQIFFIYENKDNQNGISIRKHKG